MSKATLELCNATPTPLPTLASWPMPELTFTVAFPAGLGVNPNENLHWARKAERNGLVRDLTQGHAQVAARACGWACAGRATLTLTVVWGKGGKIRDHDNLATMLKPLVDGLVRAKLFTDDKPKCLTIAPLIQERDPKTYWPVVKITVRREDDHDG